MDTPVADLPERKTNAQLKKENEALRREVKAAMLTIDLLLKDANKRREEIDHLQSLVSQVVPVIKPEKKIEIISEPEREIAEMQLERLRSAAQNRILTLEETRMFDLLVKNKRLAKDESTINMQKGSYRDLSEVELIQIVGKTEKDK